MKTLVVWVWAFWFAILKHLSSLNKNKTFFAVEKDELTLKTLLEKRENPYFYNWVKLWENIEFFSSENFDYSSFDLIIVAIPAQFVWGFLDWIKSNLKPGVTFLNLAKWIDNKNIETIWEIFDKKLVNFDFKYASLSGWMIALELVEEKILWATISSKNTEVLEYLKDIFNWNNLEISLSNDVKNSELSGSIKNIISLYIWYLEAKWNNMSSIWYYLSKIFKEIPILFVQLWWEEKIKFEEFYFIWDIIATCFGDSRNKYFWKLVWSWISPIEAKQKLALEKKHAEWYETLIWIQNIIKNNKNLVEFNKIISIFL